MHSSRKCYKKNSWSLIKISNIHWLKFLNLHLYPVSHHVLVKLMEVNISIISSLFRLTMLSVADKIVNVLIVEHMTARALCNNYTTTHRLSLSFFFFWWPSILPSPQRKYFVHYLNLKSCSLRRFKLLTYCTSSKEYCNY